MELKYGKVQIGVHNIKMCNCGLFYISTRQCIWNFHWHKKHCSWSWYRCSEWIELRVKSLFYYLYYAFFCPVTNNQQRIHLSRFLDCWWGFKSGTWVIRQLSDPKNQLDLVNTPTYISHIAAQKRNNIIFHQQNKDNV